MERVQELLQDTDIKIAELTRTYIDFQKFNSRPLRKGGIPELSKTLQEAWNPRHTHTYKQ